MIAAIIKWSIRNRFMVILVTCAVIAAGVMAMRTIPLDAIPDLSDTQVIIMTEYSGQSPQVVEDQVTYPLTTAMLSVPYAKVVRGYSFFGLSFVYIIFEDGTDLYWARSRVLEYLNFVTGRLPAGVTPSLGPDATGVGWVYEYFLEDTSGKHDLSELRSIQDWYLRFELAAIPGVSEVASIGGFVKQYQVEVDPDRLLAYNIPLSRVKTAIRRANGDVGGRVLEMGETEFMVRGLGYIKSIADLEKTSLGVDENGTPVLLRNVADIHLGPELRRGILDVDGQGEAAGGIIVMRSGENGLEVIHRVKKRLAELEKGLPAGIKIRAGYDRSGLILRAVETLKGKLIEEMAVVAVICVIFLLHFRSALVAVFTLPVGIMIAFIVMRAMGINANIMSLGGIAIAIGVMVDASVVMVENAHKHLEQFREKGGGMRHPEIISLAAQEVGPALFYSLLIITVSFLPVFALGEQSGRLFKPLAYTKTFAMAASAVLAITIIPVLMTFFVRERMTTARMSGRRVAAISALPVAALLLAASLGFDPGSWGLVAAAGTSFLFFLCLLPQKLMPETANPVNRLFMRIYLPVIDHVLAHPWRTITAAAVLVAVSAVPASRLGREFMPPLNEGDLLYMPTTLPGISITKARELLQQTDRIIKSFPEVKTVYGKIGRAETATDPAPLSMIETTITLKPKEVWEYRKVERFFSSWPEWLKKPLTFIWPERVRAKLVSHWRRKKTKRFYSWLPEWLKLPPLTTLWPEERYITMDELADDLNQSIRFPGLTNAWTMPIKTRIDMLSTGIKTPVGIKIMGPDLEELSRLGSRIEAMVRQLPGTLSAYAERITGGNYLDFVIDRDEIARYGLSVADVEEVIVSAIGGMNVTWTVEGLERYPVNLRYPRGLRDDPERLKRVLVAAPTGAQVPLGQLAEIRIHKGPAMIKSENGRRTAWVFVDIRGMDVGSYVKMARQTIDHEIKLPPGYSIVWSGQYEYMEKARATLKLIVPATLAVIFVLLFLHFGNLTEAAVVMGSLPFALVGGIWLLYLLDYNISVAVVVGFIALAGLAAETGVVMLVYLDQAYARHFGEKTCRSREELKAAIIEGAVERVRPKLMTVATTLIGLLPVMAGHGTGSQVMKRIAAPMVGGLVSSTVLTLVILPAIYFLWKSGVRRQETGDRRIDYQI